MLVIILLIAMTYVIACLFIEAETSEVRTILCEQEETTVVEYKGIPPPCTYDESPSRLS